MPIPTVKTPPGFPPCVSLTLHFNEHASLYETAEAWILDEETEGCYFSWVSLEERQRAIDTDSVWICQWYPDTPVGFCALAASSFDVLMARVNGSTGHAP